MNNPVDRDCVNAMIEYRQNQLVGDLSRPDDVSQPEFAYTPLTCAHPVRRAIVLRLMRFGARLAGISLYARIGPQL